MKLCKKDSEPNSLQTYRSANPKSTWEQMRGDALNNGQKAYSDIKRELIKSQRCLCAYCEIYIAKGISDEQIEQDKNNQRVEHFHPKSDKTMPPNWALSWGNLWAVCNGGSNRPPDGSKIDASLYLPPLPDNLSCDAFKDRQIETGKLSSNPEGYILSPGEVPPFPLLFEFSFDGSVSPHRSNCAKCSIPSNKFNTTSELVENTIKNLNLGCVRLKNARRIAKSRLEKTINQEHKKNPGIPANVILSKIARRFFSQGTGSPWPQFFSLVRSRLEIAAETQLQTISFSG